MKTLIKFKGMIRGTCSLIILILVIPMAAFANVVSYKAPELLARANIHDGFHLPAMTFLHNPNPVINNRGDVAFKVMALEGQTDQALWVKTSSEITGKIAYIAPDDRHISAPSLNDEGQIAFNLYDEGVTDGLFILDSLTEEVNQVLNPDDQPLQYYTYPQIKNQGMIYFRATNDSDERSYNSFGNEKFTKILGEGVETAGLKAAYLFRPSFNESGSFAFKARGGEKGQWNERNPDQIVIVKPSIDFLLPAPQMITIAKDSDSDSTSPYRAFGNVVSLSETGTVAFFAITETVDHQMKKSILLFKDNILTQIAKDDLNDISEIDLTTLKINEQGNVLFRAKDKNHLSGLYLANTESVTRIIGEGDRLETDLGPGKILSNPNFPAFSGDVDMNDSGEIVFHCLIVDEDNRELGSAVYKMTPNL
jgi:hypothetical protein